METGWIVRCVGRQPWIVYGELRTVESASNLPPGEVLFSLVGLSTMYIVFLFTTLYFGSRIVRNGPDLTLPAPRNTEIAFLGSNISHELNRRPADIKE